MSEYIMNKETGKIELHFDKADYLALPEDKKREIKSNFLFSRAAGAWVSRCKFPHLYRPEQVAKSLGLENAGTVGEFLTFEEQQERKQERAEARADRYEYKAEKAQQEGKRLQAPIDRMHGDIAFFTQPNINTSAGRAFTRQRNRMWDAWERGFEEFKKSEYYEQAAAVARTNSQKPTDKGFCDRRIKDAEKTIRAQKKNIEHYQARLDKINAGETLTNWKGETLTAADVEGWIEEAEQIIEQAISKIVYYKQCIEEIGGPNYTQADIKPGYIVRIGRREPVKVKSTGPVNFVYETATGFTLRAAYAEIQEIIKAEEEAKEPHPFKAGETFTIYNRVYEIIKATASTVTIKTGDREYRKTPKKRFIPCEGRERWCLAVDSGYMGTIYR